jgi:hypothetical protein
MLFISFVYSCIFGGFDWAGKPLARTIFRLNFRRVKYWSEELVVIELTRPADGAGTGQAPTKSCWLHFFILMVG